MPNSLTLKVVVYYSSFAAFYRVPVTPRKLLLLLDGVRGTLGHKESIGTSNGSHTTQPDTKQRQRPTTKTAALPTTKTATFPKKPTAFATKRTIGQGRKTYRENDGVSDEGQVIRSQRRRSSGQKRLLNHQRYSYIRCCQAIA